MVRHYIINMLALYSIKAVQNSGKSDFCSSLPLSIGPVNGEGSQNTTDHEEGSAPMIYMTKMTC